MFLSQRDTTMGQDIQQRIRDGFRADASSEYDIRQRLAYGARQVPLLQSICYPQEVSAESQPTWPWEEGKLNSIKTNQAGNETETNQR